MGEREREMIKKDTRGDGVARAMVRNVKNPIDASVRK
jgi:hypothetical protein